MNSDDMPITCNSGYRSHAGSSNLGSLSCHQLHYGRWISQLLRNCFGIVAQPAPAGDDVRDLGPGEMRTPLRKRFRTFSARLAKKFRKLRNSFEIFAKSI
ncbi:hypothetical protein PGTUg99_033030 [Puccinia graminis f. sp. tritici]|uniref:Uncharacterized protein n=1 Tax=Puccinia graminis f. sp. tritici TaxID=56615 RepID=A0A5B0MEA1_PUCGR|nr:hypothetical protein PGTUg99_033030 [Puccinia graminis f. sp. tritici]